MDSNHGKTKLHSMFCKKIPTRYAYYLFMLILLKNEVSNNILTFCDLLCSMLRRRFYWKCSIILMTYPISRLNKGLRPSPSSWRQNAYTTLPMSDCLVGVQTFHFLFLAVFVQVLLSMDNVVINTPYH